MAFCEFCNTEGQKTGACACCGNLRYTAGVTFIYGPTEKDSYGCEFRLTDKYLIVRSVSKGEMTGNVAAGAAFGLLGALAAEAVNASRSKDYGFYDLQELQKVIYPYHTGGLKKDTAFKFVNKDGSDFILNFNLNGMFCVKNAKTFADLLRQAGISMENGSAMTNPVCCARPFVNQLTFGTRVCPSAAAFVRMSAKQFAAPSVSGADAQPAYQAPAYKAPAAPAYQAPAQPVYQAPAAPVYQAATQHAAAAWQPTWQAPPAPQTKVCPKCGAVADSSAKFCSKCGTALAPTQPATPADSLADAWKSQW